MKTNADFFVMSRSAVLKMINFSSKVAGKIKTHFTSNNVYCKLCRL